MQILVACEFSARVRDAFIARGHDAWSCDILPTQGRAGNHLQGDVRHALDGNLARFPDAIDIRTRTRPAFRRWEALIAFPPCTRLCNSGVRWLSKPPVGRSLGEMWAELEEGAALFSDLLNCDIPRKCIENPVMHRHAKAMIRNYRPPTQIIQPWQFGDGQTKKTCLWLENLPPLEPTNIVAGRKPVTHYMSPSKDRPMLRSVISHGIADAMAAQWSRVWAQPLTLNRQQELEL